MKLPKIFDHIISEKDMKIANRLVEEIISKGKLESTKETRDRICSELKTDESKYYRALNILISSGLIAKGYKVYTLNKDFINTFISDWFKMVGLNA